MPFIQGRQTCLELVPPHQTCSRANQSLTSSSGPQCHLLFLFIPRAANHAVAFDVNNEGCQHAALSMFILGGKKKKKRQPKRNSKRFWNNLEATSGIREFGNLHAQQYPGRRTRLSLEMPQSPSPSNSWEKMQLQWVVRWDSETLPQELCCVWAGLIQNVGRTCNAGVTLRVGPKGGKEQTSPR